ncbi:casein kinase 2 regulatory subunit, partial [Borealophlyctis nickersoniae]
DAATDAAQSTLGRLVARGERVDALRDKIGTVLEDAFLVECVNNVGCLADALDNVTDMFTKRARSVEDEKWWEYHKTLNALTNLLSALGRLTIFDGDEGEDVDVGSSLDRNMNGHLDESMEAMSETSESGDSTAYWTEWFQSLRGNEFFCDVDEEYILDRFNLTGLQNEVNHYSIAFDLITDSLDEDLDDDNRSDIEKAARHLYGLIHARFIITSRGLGKMMEKFRRAEFGKCPRVMCDNQAVLPIGLTDVPNCKGVKLYCPKCEDVYTPPSKRHHYIDGAYFGSTFPHLLLQVYPQLMPQKVPNRYVPKIFGFRIHQTAKEHRKQDELRKEQQKRLQQLQAAEE